MNDVQDAKDPGHDARRRSQVRLAELVATMSLGTDLGLGQPMEHVLRQTLIALRLGEHLGLGASDRRVLYYSGLLAWVGCFTDAYEQAKWFGDDIALKADGFALEGGAAGYFLGHLGLGQPWPERIRLGVAFLGQGRRAVASMLENHYLATDELAARLSLGDDVRASLQQTFERWDGKHAPLGLKGEQILLTSRLIHLANVIEVFHRGGGIAAAVAAVRERSGSEFDPALVTLFCDEAENLCGDLDAATHWDAVIAAEPSLATVISDEQFEGVLEAIADFVDLKSPYTIGHSRGVADLAANAARAYGLPDDEMTMLRRAALVHDFGRLGISNAIWDKRGALTQTELERLRLHPYLSERMLSFSPVLAPLGAIAVQHHERLDGSGYPRGLAGNAISPAGRLLAAADTYQAKIEPRPHRPALSPEEAAAALRAEVAADREEFRRGRGVAPGLAVVLVGEDPASEVYVRTKAKATRDAGMASFEHKLDAATGEAALLRLVGDLNRRTDVHGILVQLPLPAHIDAAKVIEAIDPAKDVDGFHPINVGRLAIGEPALTPCTPTGCVILAKSVRPKLEGLEAVVIGRSNIVGKPMAQLLLNENCTVTIAHSRTRGLPEVVRRADLVVAAAGRAEMVRGDWIKPGAVVIDVGIQRVAGPDGKSRLVGDVAFEEAAAVAGAITPVPGGVGPMTVACLLRNTLQAAKATAG